MISFLPQVLRTIKTKKTDDISVLLLLCTLISGVLYEAYAFLLSLYPVVVMNGIFVLLVVWQLVLTIKYRQAPSAHPQLDRSSDMTPEGNK